MHVFVNRLRDGEIADVTTFYATLAADPNRDRAGGR